jgi:hypothetical protein
LNKDAPVSDDRIEELVNQAVLNVPSSFNSQSARLVVLLKKEHDQFWDFAKEALKPLVPPEAFPATEKKLAGFKAAYGTVRLSFLSFLIPGATPNLPSIGPLTIAPTDPLLRRPDPRPNPAKELPPLRRQVPNVVRTHVRDAPVRALGGPRG